MKSLFTNSNYNKNLKNSRDLNNGEMLTTEMNTW